MNEVLVQSKATEKFALLSYLALIMALVVFKRDWVLSGVVGSLTAMINYRIQIKILIKFGEKLNPFNVIISYYLRFAVVGGVLYLSFSRSVFNPYVVFSFILLFYMFILISAFYKKK